jgi:hypothetical protein
MAAFVMAAQVFVALLSAGGSVEQFQQLSAQAALPTAKVAVSQVWVVIASSFAHCLLVEALNQTFNAFTRMVRNLFKTPFFLFPSSFSFLPCASKEGDRVYIPIVVKGR